MAAVAAVAAGLWWTEHEEPSTWYGPHERAVRRVPLAAVFPNRTTSPPGFASETILLVSVGGGLVDLSAKSPPKAGPGPGPSKGSAAGDSHRDPWPCEGPLPPGLLLLLPPLPACPRLTASTLSEPRRYQSQGNLRLRYHSHSASELSGRDCMGRITLLLPPGIGS